MNDRRIEHDRVTALIAAFGFDAARSKPVRAQLGTAQCRHDDDGLGLLTFASLDLPDCKCREQCSAWRQHRSDRRFRRTFGSFKLRSQRNRRVLFHCPLSAFAGGSSAPNCANAISRRRDDEDMIPATDENIAIGFDGVPGQDHDGPRQESLLDQVDERLPNLDEVVADKAYAGSPQIDACVDFDLFPQVPNKSNAVEPRPFDNAAYKERNEVERLIGKAKQSRRIATRYDKLTTTFKAFLAQTFTMIAMKAL